MAVQEGIETASHDTDTAAACLQGRAVTDLHFQPLKDDRGRFYRGIRVCLSVAAIVLCLAFSSGCVKTSNASAMKGYLDLTGYEFDELNIGELKGQWEFYRGVILSPEEARRTSPPEYFTLPGLWEELVIGRGPRDPNGSATLRLRVRLPDTMEEIAIRIPEMNCAYALWIDGVKKFEDGDVLAPGPSELRHSGPRLVRFQPLGRETEIVFQISSYNDNRRGIQYPIFIGAEVDMTRIRRAGQLIDAVIFGFLFFAGLYHVGLFIGRRKEEAALHFGIFCLLIAIRVMNVSENIIDTLFEHISFETGVRLEHMTMYLGMPSISLFIRALYPKEVSRTYVYSILSIGAIAAVLTFMLPLHLSGRMIFPYQVVMLGCITYILVALSLATARGRELSIALLVGYVLLSATVVHDILNDMKFIDTFYLVPFGMFSLVLFQSYILSMRYNYALDRTERLRDELERRNWVIQDYSENLEQMVELRTRVIMNQKRDLDEQVVMAEKIQQAILPSVMPAMDVAEMDYRYVPVMQIGGDFLDYSYSQSRGLALVVCDVSGHGISGAFLASMVKMALSQMWDAHFDDPVGLLSSIRASMQGKLGGHFISAIAVHVDLSSGEFRCSSAGHPPALVSRPDGSVDVIELKGSVISDFLPANYIEHRGRLEPGSTIMLYTDGITEARDTANVMFEMSRLVSSVKAHSGESPGRICDSLYAEVRSFIGETGRFDDDITLVALRYTG